MVWCYIRYSISKDTEDYCKDGKESGMTHAIGFMMDKAE